MPTKLLGLLDNNLISGTPNTAFQADLRQMRSDVASHLQAAPALRARLRAGTKLVFAPRRCGTTYSGPRAARGA